MKPKIFKARKKPVIIECFRWCKKMGSVGGVIYPYHNLVCGIDFHKLHKRKCGWIEAFKGGYIVSEGDWIISEIKKGTYPCKDNTFKKTYEIIGSKK